MAEQTRMRSTENSKENSECTPAFFAFWNFLWNVFYFVFQNIKGMPRKRRRNTNWNTPRMHTMLIFLLGYFCPVLYSQWCRFVFVCLNQWNIGRNCTLPLGPFRTNFTNFPIGWHRMSAYIRRPRQPLQSTFDLTWPIHGVDRPPHWELCALLFSTSAWVL